jgi:hypothetical protein
MQDSIVMSLLSMITTFRTWFATTSFPPGASKMAFINGPTGFEKRQKEERTEEKVEWSGRVRENQKQSHVSALRIRPVIDRLALGIEVSERPSV